MEKTGLILNEGFVNYNRNKLITFTPNIDIIEKGYGKTLMYDYIYQEIKEEQEIYHSDDGVCC